MISKVGEPYGRIGILDFYYGEGVNPYPASATDKKIVSLIADKLSAGNITVLVGLGQGDQPAIELDGVNRRIVIKDSNGNRRVSMGREDT